MTIDRPMTSRLTIGPTSLDGMKLIQRKPTVDDRGLFERLGINAGIPADLGADLGAGNGAASTPAAMSPMLPDP